MNYRNFLFTVVLPRVVLVIAIALFTGLIHGDLLPFSHGGYVPVDGALCQQMRLTGATILGGPCSPVMQWNYLGMVGDFLLFFLIGEGVIVLCNFLFRFIVPCSIHYNLDIGIVRIIFH